jgi:hypothetical protein
MRTKPISAFGTVVFIVTADVGECINVNLRADGSYSPGFYYFISGEVTPVVIETGEILQKRTRGWFNKTKEDRALTSGTLKLLYPVQSSWVCIPYNINNYKDIPQMIDNDYGIDSEIFFKNGDDVLLVQGIIKIGTKEFVAPSQIRIRTGDVYGLAMSDCLTLKFIK